MARRAGWDYAWSRPLTPVESPLEVGPDPIVFAVIADTHGRPHPRTLERLAAMSPAAILHAGDVGDARCIEVFREVAPLVVVRGNIDGLDWPDTRLLAVMEGPRPRLRILLTHIAVDRLSPSRVALEAARAHRADLIVCGHSHVPFLTEFAGRRSRPSEGQFRRRPGEARLPAKEEGEGAERVVLFNPGSCGPRRFHLPIVLGRIELGQDRLSLTHLDVETGEPWRPG